MLRMWIIGMSVFTLVSASAVDAQVGVPSPVDQFAEICGTTNEGMARLPGEDIDVSRSPPAFKMDLQRASSSRVVKIGDRYALRAIIPSQIDPVHAVTVKCALAFGPASYSEEVQKLSAKLEKPSSASGNENVTTFYAGNSSFFVYRDADHQVSIYKINVLIRNIDSKQLKNGATPVPGPIAQ